MKRVIEDMREVQGHLAFTAKRVTSEHLVWKECQDNKVCVYSIYLVLFRYKKFKILSRFISFESYHKQVSTVIRDYLVHEAEMVAMDSMARKVIKVNPD